MMRAPLLLSILVLLGFPLSAFAACTNPAGEAGDTGYNSDYAVMQFCNGSSWVSMAASGALTELDPHVGTLTANNFCTSNVAGSQVVCTTSAINLASQVTGNLSIANLGGGTSASSTTFWRGDGTWASPSLALPTLTSANIWVGNGSSVATALAPTGDVTITNAGVTAIGAGKVTNVMLAGSIDLATKVSGNLPVANLGGGTSASATTSTR